MQETNVHHHALKKTIGIWTATAIAIGITIGSGIFVKPALVLSQTGSSTLALLAWLMGGLMAICGGLTVAEVAARIPKTGGIYTYIEELFGKKLGFLSGWVQTVIYGPGLMGALGLYFATLLSPFLGYDSKYIKAVAVGAVIFLAIMNILATKLGGVIQNITTVGKLIPIYVIAAVGLFMGHEGIAQTVTVDTAKVSFGAAVLSTLWAYDGWILVGNVGGEMENANRNLPRAILYGLGIIIVGYLGMNIAVFHTLPSSEVLSLGVQAPGRAAEVLLGTWGGKLITIGILVSIFGCLNGTILSSPRIPYAMASRGDLKNYDYVTWVHPRFNTPYVAIVMQALIGILMILLASPDQITDFAIFSVYIFYTLAFVGVFILRKRDPSFSGYKTPLFPWTPILAILSSFYILGNTVLDNPKLVAISLITTLIGLPVYFLIRKKT